MKKLKASLLAFTLIELLVVISIIAILASLAIPAVTSALVRGQSTQTLSNMRELHKVAYSMSLDASTTGDTNLGWPGDLPSKTWAGWVTNAVPGYLKTNDMAKMLTAPGIAVPPTADLTTLTPGTKTSGRALILYQVAETNTSTTVLFSTANFTNTSSGGTPPLGADALPYGDKLFIVFRKGGDGNVLQTRQVGSTNVIGDFVQMQN